jgi:hypothetical protein
MDDKIYKNQDCLKLRAYVGCSLSDATVLMKYKTPLDVEGSWAVTVEDEANGVVYKRFVVGEYLGISGVWTFWAHVTFEDGRVAPGEPFTVMVYDEGS